MPVQDNTAEAKQAEIDRLRRELEEAQDKKSDKLLPFINAVYEKHAARIESLTDSKADREDKIARNQDRIQKLSDKADRLEATNEMLKALLGNSIFAKPVEAMIAQNQQRIDKIRNVSIPKCEQRIEKHKAKIAGIEQKIKAQQSKADKCKAFSGIIKSFTIPNAQERRQLFAQSLDTLNAASKSSLEVKIAKCERQKDALSAQYMETESAADKLGIQKRFTAVNQRASELKERLAKLEAVELPFTEQPVVAVDKLMHRTESEIDTAVQNGDVDIATLSEDIVVSGAEYLRSAEIELEDDLDSIDGIINNGKQHEEAEEELDWLEQMVSDGKAVVNDDGSFKINPDYYKALGKENRHIEALLAEVANDVIFELAAKGVEFSAVTRSDDVVAITVSKADVDILNDRIQDVLRSRAEMGLSDEITEPQRHQGSRIQMQDGELKSTPRKNVADMSKIEQLQYLVDTDIILHNGVSQDTVEAIRKMGFDIDKTGKVVETQPMQQEQPKPRREYSTINPEYYASLTKANRETTAEPKAIAEKIMADLDSKGIKYSGVERKGGMIAITVAKADVAAFQAAEQAAKGEHLREVINPEFFKSLSKEERFIKKMPEQEARAAIAELSQKGIEHSAVLNGDESRVTIRKQDAPRASFSRKQLKQQAARMQPKKDKPQPTKHKGQNLE